MKRLILSLAVVYLSLAGNPGEAQKPSGSVKVKASAGHPDADGRQVIELTMTIDAGWHVYAHAPGEAFETAKTRVDFVGANQPKVMKIDYPAGKPMETDGEKFLGYDGQVAIRAAVQRANANRVEIEVRFQACNDKQCFPSLIKFTVP